jgi:hypothetical protein
MNLSNNLFRTRSEKLVLKMTFFNILFLCKSEINDTVLLEFLRKFAFVITAHMAWLPE